jgi:pyruvate formate lyase activating enzyme
MRSILENTVSCRDSRGLRLEVAAGGESPPGTVFNIMRFSTHDGPGIRTTVFLKGCPLSCWWCHNPENWQHVPSEVYRRDRCSGCGICIDSCPQQALERTPQGIVANPDRCVHCGRCVQVCPFEARERTLWKVEVSGLTQSIARDIPFYEQSGGGVTFSGGEPLCQPDFLLAMLAECARHEIHRAVDTSGYAAGEVLMAAARLTDLFLYDLKVLDPVKHALHTGVDNDLILKNLRLLSDSGAEVAIRIPLIPGVNDDDENIARTGEFIAGLPQRHRVELLPYHRTAGPKYAKLGLSFRGEHISPPDPSRMADILQRLQRFDLTVGVGG